MQRICSDLKVYHDVHDVTAEIIITGLDWKCAPLYMQQYSVPLIAVVLIRFHSNQCGFLCNSCGSAGAKISKTLVVRWQNTRQSLAQCSGQDCPTSCVGQKVRNRRECGKFSD